MLFSFVFKFEGRGYWNETKCKSAYYDDDNDGNDVTMLITMMNKNENKKMREITVLVLVLFGLVIQCTLNIRITKGYWHDLK